MTVPVNSSRMCVEAAAELSEATERILRMLLSGGPGSDAGKVADAVYSVITQAKAGVVLLERAHLDLEVAAGRPPGTGGVAGADAMTRVRAEQQDRRSVLAAAEAWANLADSAAADPAALRAAGDKLQDLLLKTVEVP